VFEQGIGLFKPLHFDEALDTAHDQSDEGNLLLTSGIKERQLGLMA